MYTYMYLIWTVAIYMYVYMYMVICHGEFNPVQSSLYVPWGLEYLRLSCVHVC